MTALRRGQIMKVVNRYIGVSGGYLGDFSYRTHADFYSEYCDLDIDPNKYEGTTRERFIEILTNASPSAQAKILRGVLERFPLEDEPKTRTQQLHVEVLQWARSLEHAPAVEGDTPATAGTLVETALRDARILIEKSGATSGVDRVHTALHGYLLVICRSAGLEVPSDANMTQILKRLIAEHPALSDLGPRGDDMKKVLRSASAILDALNPVRNRGSLAHPNDDLLPMAEAVLVINIARTFLQYLQAKMGQ